MPYRFMKLYWTQLVVEGFDKVIVDPFVWKCFRVLFQKNKVSRIATCNPVFS